MSETYSVKENPGLSGFYPNGVSDRGFGACGVWGWLVGSAPLARGEVGWGHSRFFAVFLSLLKWGGKRPYCFITGTFF